MVKSFRKFLEFTENNPEEIRKALTSAGVHVRMQHSDLSSDERKRLVHDHLRSQGHHVTKDGRIALNPKWYDGKSHDKFKKKAIKRFGEGNDPKVGTGKKPPGTDRRLYTDENPDDTVPIRFATVADAERTVAKVKKISKPFARKIQILNVGQQRAKVMGKTGVVNKFETGKNQIRSKEMAKRAKEK